MTNRWFGAATMASVFTVGCAITSAWADSLPSKCGAAKIRAATAYGSCRLKAESKAVQRGGTPDTEALAKCGSKLAQKFQKSETQAPGLCPTEGDEPDIDAQITTHTTVLARCLSGGVCSNGCRLPVSGQVASEGSGDDGDVQAGVALSYVDNGDGTISDVNTGLMWEKKVALNGSSANCTNEAGSCANPHDADNRYDWTATGTAYDGAAVTIFLVQLNHRCNADVTVPCADDAACAGVGGACGFAGHRDWRLANVRELQSIISYDGYGPAVAPAFHGASCGPSCTDLGDPACSCTNPQFYWASTTGPVSPANAWWVNFYDGSIDMEVKTTKYWLRAVRNF